MKYFTLFTLMFCSLSVYAAEVINITPDNAEQYQIGSKPSAIDDRFQYIFKFPQSLEINGKKADCFAMANIIHRGQKGAENQDVVSLPQYGGYAYLIGTPEGLSASSVTITYSVDGNVELIYLISLEDWIQKS